MTLVDGAPVSRVGSNGLAYRSDIAVDDLIVDIDGVPLSLERQSTGGG